MMTQGFEELDELYKDIILEHFRSPRKCRLLAEPDAEVEAFNPFCGDEMTLHVKVSGGRVEDIGITGRGCSISQSSGSMMAELVEGLSIDEVRISSAALSPEEFLIGPNIYVEDSDVPQEFSLSQNYPNPFNPVTTINFSIPSPGRVTLKIYNILGHHVETLFNNRLLAGTHAIQWNASTYAGGVYFYRLQINEFIETKKLLLLK